MSKQHYNTDERNVQIVLALLKAHGIKRVIASPGTTNMTFVESVQNDPWFQVWSSVDERSAAYLACGMASETGEPVVISCTGATASRNYMSGLTEAYYRKLPVLAITSTRGNHKVGHLMDQQIDRRSLPNDIAMESVTIPIVKDSDDEKYCEIEANKAILALKINGGGPAHINMYSKYSRGFGVVNIPPVRCINRYTEHDELPELPSKGRIAVFVGAHQPFSDSQLKAIETFCATNNAVVFTERTSGYNGKYACMFNIVAMQKVYTSPLVNVELLINIGEVNSGLYKLNAKIVWRVSPDGALRDPWENLRDVFMMPEEVFFNHYSKEGANQTEYIDACNEELNKFINMCPELPFGNVWLAQQSCSRIPAGSKFHMGIYNSLRSWSFFPINKGVDTRCNVGGFGIDGGLSTMVGSSLVRPDVMHYGVFGDLAFFYDMNVLGNRHLGKNLRIILVNNSCGTEFKNYGHPAYFLGDDANQFIAACGHYGNKSPELVKHYVTDLGFEYMSASTKEEYMSVVDRFFTPEDVGHPMLLEVFTDEENESESLKIMFHLEDGSIVDRAKYAVKESLSKALSPETKTLVKKIIGK